MTRTVAPGTPQSLDVKLKKIPSIDFTVVAKLGDDKINAANTNFKLYAQNLLAVEQKKLFEQYKTDPINLSNALGKLPEIISDLPEDIQNEMQARLALSNTGLVQKAQESQLIQQDEDIKLNAARSVENLHNAIIEDYYGVMKNAMSPMVERNQRANDSFLSQIINLQELSEIKDHNGKYIYSEEQKKKILNISDAQMETGKQFIDNMILNDDDNLTQTKDYYQQFVLAPERFMADNYMNRETYEKFKSYVKNRMEEAGVKAKGLKFQQSVVQATALQVNGNLPGTLENLKEEGFIDKKIIDQIEKTNVKFDELDPSKTVAGTFINALKIISDIQYVPVPKNQEEQQKILEQGVYALDAVADYAQKYGMSPADVQRIREMIVNVETNNAFEPILANFRDIIDNFDVALETSRKRSTSKDTVGVFADIVNATGTDDPEKARQVKELNDLLAIGTDNINHLIRQGDWAGVRAEQKRIQRQAALIKYPWVDIESYNLNPDATFTSPKGRIVKIKDFTFNGDIMFETLN